MKEQLEHLLRLQEADLEILNLQKKIKEIPQEIQLLEENLQQSQGAFEAVEKRLEENRERRRSQERQVEDLRQQLSKYKAQLMEVKSNKEYQAMLHEIEGVGKAISEHEDGILEMMMEADEMKDGLQSAQREAQQREKEAQQQRKEKKAFARHADQRIAQLLERKEELSQSVASKVLALYQRVAAGHSGVAMAEARDHSCQVCHVRLRPQVFAEVRTNREIHRCDSCSRILYYRPPPPEESQAAQKSA
ncbi:MAG: C4-type zinc ribbon domain-containing protein [Acidobacteriota bacterium]